MNTILYALKKNLHLFPQAKGLKEGIPDEKEWMLDDF
jgi:hypothetical protein